MAEQTEDRKAAEAVFTKALELRNFEIIQLSQRNNFFMIFQGVLFAGLLQSGHAAAVVSFLACCAGFVVSVLQAGMAAGAKYWQERWEFGLENAEEILLKTLSDDPERAISIQMFHQNSDETRKKMTLRFLEKNKYSLFNQLIICKPSVSRIPIYAGCSLALIWLMLLSCTLSGPEWLAVPHWITGFATK